MPARGINPHITKPIPMFNISIITQNARKYFAKALNAANPTSGHYEMAAQIGTVRNTTTGQVYNIKPQLLSQAVLSQTALRELWKHHGQIDATIHHQQDPTRGVNASEIMGINTTAPATAPATTRSGGRWIAFVVIAIALGLAYKAWKG